MPYTKYTRFTARAKGEYVLFVLKTIWVHYLSAIQYSINSCNGPEGESSLLTLMPDLYMAVCRVGFSSENGKSKLMHVNGL